MQCDVLFRFEMEGARDDWRQFHNEKRNDLFCSHNFMRGGEGDSWHVWGRGEVRTWFWCGELKEREHLEEMLVDGEDNLKRDLK